MKHLCLVPYVIGLIAGVAVLPNLGASDYLLHSPGLTVELALDGKLENSKVARTPQSGVRGFSRPRPQKSQTSEKRGVRYSLTVQVDRSTKALLGGFTVALLVTKWGLAMSKEEEISGPGARHFGLASQVLGLSN
jgi:hypothetical protein